MSVDRRRNVRARVALSLCCCAGALAALAGVASAADAPRPLQLVSTPHSGSFDESFVGASKDGTRLFFSTDGKLSADDANSTSDIYERDSAGLHLISGGGQTDFAETFDGASADGTRAFFDTDEKIPGTGDTNTTNDVYERDGDGTLHLISTGDQNGLGAFFDGASADGTRVFFETDDKIDTGDTNTTDDIYERDSTGFHLISTGDQSGFRATFRGASADGTRVFFTTSEKIDTGDTNTTNDVYERDSTGLHLISTGGQSGFNAFFFDRASADGTRAFFETDEKIPNTGDENNFIDVYERDSDSTLHLISTGDQDGLGVSSDGASADGTRVFFTTNEPIPNTGDENTRSDIYERDSTGFHLVSSGDRQASAASFDGASADGTRVFFTTNEPIPGTGDRNTASDVYERDSDGSLRLVSSGDQHAPDAAFNDASDDGTRVFFTTDEAIPGTGDNDKTSDVYERDSDGTLRLVSTGDSASVPAFFQGTSADGARVFFHTREPIPGTGDDDISDDVYERSLAGPSFSGAATVRGAAAVGTQLTCAPGAIVGERVTSSIAWLRDSSPIAGATGTTYTATTTDAGHKLACRITIANPIGSATQTSGAVTVASVDRARPSVKILTPACPRKTSRKACANLRARARTWRTLHGTVTDPKPSSGIARVELNIVRTHGKTCSYYNGKRFTNVSCKTAAKHYISAKLTAGGHWTVTLRTLPAGAYTIRARATDKAKHTTTTTRKLRLR